MAFIGSDAEWVSSHFCAVPEKVEQLCGPLAGRGLLDVGCGDMLSDFGLVAKGAAHVTGLDIHPAGLSDLPRVYERLRSHGHRPPEDFATRLTYRSYGGTSFPFADGTFDMVMSWGVFEHVADVPAVLREMGRVVKPSGHVLIVVYPWYPCFFGSHLTDFIDEPFFHLKRDDSWVRARLEEHVARHPESRELVLGHLWEQYRTLNRYSATRFHQEVVEAGFRVLHCELLAYPQDVRGLPPDASLTEAMICGSTLLLEPASAAAAFPEPSIASRSPETSRAAMNQRSVPLPPVPMRGLVSPLTDDSYYDNPTGEYIWGPLDIGPLQAGEAYRRVLDFGCGCGREARRLLLQTRRPDSYVGIDVNHDMIDWCRRNLDFEGFSFHHHDVWSVVYAPKNTRNRVLPIDHLGGDFTLVEANSVFTHLHADQSEFYLRQMASMLSPTGLIRASWFLFNKKCFPMMSASQNTLFIDEVDTTAAVYYDWQYLVDLAKSLGLRVVRTEWSPVLGFHNIVYMARSEAFEDLSGVRPPGQSVLGYF